MDEPPSQLGDSPEIEHSPMPPDLRRQLLEDIDNGESDDPFAGMHDSDTMVPEGDFRPTATPVGSAPEDAIGSMQHMISDQMERLKGTKIRGIYVSDEDPGNPERYVKGKSDRTIVPIMQDPRVVFCDLATADGRAEYERVMDLLATSLGTYQLFEKELPPHIVVDRNGVAHAIVVLKYCRMSKVIAVKREKYTEISEEMMKEKFFPNHKDVKVEPEEDDEETEVDDG